MENELTIDDAIDQGIISANAPPVLVIVITVIISFLLDVALRLNFWLFFICSVLAVIGAWLLWSRRLMKWRLWAFANVRNVHELKKRAEQKQLLWPEGSFMYSIEFKFADLNKQWQALSSKFNVPDIFIPDSNIPDETVICYSVDKNRWGMASAIILMIAGFFLLSEDDSTFFRILAIALIVCSVYLLVRSFRNSKDKSPQLIINDKGIWTIKSGNFPWNEISNEEAITVQSRRTANSYLVFQHSKGKEKINIDVLDTDTELLNKLLIYYRLKSGNNNG